MVFEKLKRFLTSKINSRVVFSDGSIVEYLNREAIMYHSPMNLQMEIVWDFDNNLARGKILRKQDINYWNYPNQDIEISPIEKKIILNSVIDYAKRKKIPLTVVE